MSGDEKIDIILKSLDHGHIVPMYDWIAQTLNEHDRQSEQIHRVLIRKMVDARLIDKGSTDNREVYSISPTGSDILTNGGWLKHIVDQMSEGEKIHRLLGFMANTQAYHWTAESLMPAFNELLNEHEIEYLCQQLIDNGDVNDNSTKDGLAIGFTQRTNGVFHGKRYLKPSLAQEIRIEVGQIQSIKDSIINAPVTQVQDSKLDDLKNEARTSSDRIENNTKQQAWSWPNVSFNLIIGFIVTITGGLVIVYWKEIMAFFKILNS